LKSIQNQPANNKEKIEAVVNNIYVSKKQLSILRIGLMSLTRDDKMFDFAVENGIFGEDDIHEYISTLGLAVNQMSEDDGVLIVNQINMEDIKDCSDLWGNPIYGHNPS
jgi:hypothetical protein